MALDCFAEPVVGPRFARTRRHRPGNDEQKNHAPQNIFIILVDATFTILFERLFTNAFDVIGA